MILKSTNRYNKANPRRNGKRKMVVAVHIGKRVSSTAVTKNGAARAYVLLHAVQGCSGDVVSALLQNRHVLSVDKVEDADIVAIIEAPSRTKLAAAVVHALSTLEFMIDGVDLLPA
jgi:hypothetical protein